MQASKMPNEMHDMGGHIGGDSLIAMRAKFPTDVNSRAKRGPSRESN